MKRQWFTLQEVAAKQLACPLSIGQAEAGRYTYCIGEKCMAWSWNPDQIEDAEVRTGVPVNEVEEGWTPICEPYENEEEMLVDVIQSPTHGRCGMVP